MFQCLIHVWKIVLKLDLFGISGDQPKFQSVVPSREIVVAEFEAIVHPVDTKTLLHPF